MKRYIPDVVLGLGGRDDYFRQILSQFAPSGISILQIGAIEEKKRAWRHFSGWSDIFFASYIDVFGGSLDVVDFDPEHLKNSEELLSDFNIDFTVNVSEASEFISSSNKNYDLVYLDAGNDPEETKHQYDILNKKYISIIIVDDFPIKGTAIVKDDLHKYQELPFFGGQNSMGLYVNEKTFVNKFGDKDETRMNLIRDEIVL